MNMWCGDIAHMLAIVAIMFSETPAHFFAGETAPETS